MPRAPEKLTAPQEDIDAVMRAALDYVEGYLQADPERHANAYHPEALKRRFAPNSLGIETVQYVTPQTMVDVTASGQSKDENAEYEVVIDDVGRNVASVRVYSTTWIDYLHIARGRGEWRIIHVAWEHQPGMEPA